MTLLTVEVSSFTRGKQGRRADPRRESDKARRLGDRRADFDEL
jgi:hypothetical protein